METDLKESLKNKLERKFKYMKKNQKNYRQKKEKINGKFKSFEDDFQKKIKKLQLLLLLKKKKFNHKVNPLEQRNSLISQIF